MITGGDRWLLLAWWAATFVGIFLLLGLEDRVHQWRVRRRIERQMRARAHRRP